MFSALFTKVREEITFPAKVLLTEQLISIALKTLKKRVCLKTLFAVLIAAENVFITRGLMSCMRKD